MVHRYILHQLLGPEIAQHHQSVVNEIADSTGLHLTRDQGLAAHFTLKYGFESSGTQKLDPLLEDFASNSRAAPIRVSALEHFNREVLFYRVELSPEAQELFRNLIRMLRTIPWMTWDRYDAENLHFHMTIAEHCGDRFDQAWKIGKAREKEFDATFDNVTLLEQTGMRGDIDLWKPVKRYQLRY